MIEPAARESGVSARERERGDASPAAAKRETIDRRAAHSSGSSSGCSHGRRRGSSRLLRSCFGINVRCRRRARSFVRRMGWLRSLLSPLRRLWCHMNAVQRKKRGIYILYDDVKSCPCEDVHVLWSILVESHGLPPPTPMTTPAPALRPTR
uniref:Uncharacterized protein n=1 Tax=Oryza meridionalis TaxID=40149 RepID=A0A0E0C8H3_9ORYZ